PVWQEPQPPAKPAVQAAEPAPQPAPQPVAAPAPSVFQTVEEVPTPGAPTSANVPMAMAQNAAVQAELRPFLDKPEIESAMVISAKGEPVAWVGQPIEDPDTFAAYVRTLMSISSIFGDKHQLSPLQGLSLEYLGKTLIVNRVSEGHSLALLMRGTGGTGVIRYLISKQMPPLKAALGEA
ncbi:MAG: roadblock/LC7 domain-containing protein, partial [Meiothermus sp.]|nr:roadblock/LC7 domain-containing protein [Meiothermus sp.]